MRKGIGHFVPLKTGMRKIRLLLEYDGSRYEGWQGQGSRTICGKLQDVLSRMKDGNCGFETVKVVGAVRTEAGVHAVGQTACFCSSSDQTPEEIKDYLNRYLPEDIAIRKAETVPEIFHPVFSAKSIFYEYRICTDPLEYVFQKNYQKFCRKQPELARMEKAAQILSGTHDFQTFKGNPRQKKSTIRTLLSIQLLPEKTGLRICIEGDDFWPGFARRLSGTLLACGLSKIEPEDIADMLDGGTRQPEPALEANGLFLKKIRYKL